MTRLLRIGPFPANRAQISERRRDFEPVFFRRTPVVNLAEAKDIFDRTPQTALKGSEKFVTDRNGDLLVKCEDIIFVYDSIRSIELRVGGASFDRPPLWVPSCAGG